MSFTFTLSGNESVLSADYPAIDLDPEAEYVIGLISFETFNTIPNIESHNNKFYCIDEDGLRHIVTIPEGSYEIDDINKYIRRALGIDRGRRRVPIIEVPKKTVETIPDSENMVPQARSDNLVSTSKAELPKGVPQARSENLVSTSKAELTKGVNETIESPDASKNLVPNTKADSENVVSQARSRVEPVMNITANNNTLKSEIKTTYVVDFTPEGTIGPLLGFNPKKLKALAIHVSDNPVAILKVNTICIDCNIVTGTYHNSKAIHRIHQFFPRVPPGYKIVETPSNAIYLPINTRVISQITLKILDQDGNLINFRGETITVRLHLKKQHGH